jgi:hypothetical protein
MSFVRLLMRAAAPPPIAMTLAELEAAVSWASADTGTTGAFTPPANSLAVVIAAGRRDATRTIAAPSATHAMTGSWAALASAAYDIGSGNRVVIGAHGRFFGPSPGSGTITGGSAGGTFYQAALGVLSISGAAASFLLRSGGANSNSGTSLAIPYSDAAAPPADMQGIVATCSEGASTAMALAGYTLLYTVDLGGPFSVRIWAKLASVANSATVTDFTSGAIRAGANLGVAHA